MGKVERLILLQRNPIVGRFATELLSLYGVEIPRTVDIGTGLVIHHRGQGIVIGPETRIGNNVTIYHQVTIGRSGIGLTLEEQGFDEVIIEDGVVLCAGAKILGGRGTLRVGKNTVVGTNAVLTQSTNADEVWAGVPARKIAARSSSANAPPVFRSGG